MKEDYGKQDYFEVQFHGQLKASDIAAIHYRQGAPPPEVVAWAKKHNVPVHGPDEKL